MNFNSIYPVYVREKVMSRKVVEVEKIYQTKYGSLKAMDLVGIRYGTKVYRVSSKTVYTSIQK